MSTTSESRAGEYGQVSRAQVAADRNWKTDEQIADDKCRAEAEGDRFMSQEELDARDALCEQRAKQMAEDEKFAHDMLLVENDGECDRVRCKFCTTAGGEELEDDVSISSEEE
ncbi:MAG: hypothetical protein Q9181_008207 [Wetmoreana brouardii]